MAEHQWDVFTKQNRHPAGLEQATMAIFLPVLRFVICILDLGGPAVALLCVRHGADLGLLGEFFEKAKSRGEIRRNLRHGCRPQDRQDDPLEPFPRHLPQC